MRSNHFPGSNLDSPEPPPPPQSPIKPKSPVKTVGDPQEGAKLVRDGFGASVAAALSGGVSEVVGVGGFQKFREGILKDLGDPKDPLEVMLIDQLCWLHFRAGQILVASADSKLPADQAAVLTAAATRVIAEFRKTALALCEYRSPRREVPNVTINTNTQLAVVNPPAEPPVAPEILEAQVGEPLQPPVAPETFCAQVSKQLEALPHEQLGLYFHTSDRCRAPEPVEARRADSGGVTPTARSCSAQSPMVGGCCEPS